MKHLVSIFFCHVLALNSVAQTDTTTTKGQKGFLFISDYNYLYNEGEEAKPLGFHDFFFPCENLDLKCFTDSSKSLFFRNGLRIEFFEKRNDFKRKAVVYNGIDTSRCYSFDKFYIVPVIISYKLFEDNMPLICRRNNYKLVVSNGAKLNFQYEHKAISPLSVKHLATVTN